MPNHLGSPQKTFFANNLTNQKYYNGTKGSPTVNIIKNLILSPSELNSKYSTTGFKVKDSVRRNVFSPDFLAQ
jgi:hypothetical protein